MRERIRAALAAAALATAGIGAAALATAPRARAQTFAFTAAFTPDELGAPTNLSTTLDFAPGAGAPPPIARLVAYTPAGLTVDVQGIDTCQRARLEAEGPGACPAESRVGFGGGVGVLDLAGEPVKEPYTLDFFLAPREGGRLAFLIYADAVAPVALQLVLVAHEVHGPRPYGFGLEVEVPSLSFVPGAANASVESGFASLGGPDIAYFRTVRGVRRLVRVKGVIAPRTCPAGGFPFQALVTFEDGTTSSPTYAAPCPSGSS